MPEPDMKKLAEGRTALKRWQTPAEFTAKIDELARKSRRSRIRVGPLNTIASDITLFDNIESRLST